MSGFSESDLTEHSEGSELTGFGAFCVPIAHIGEVINMTPPGTALLDPNFQAALSALPEPWMVVVALFLFLAGQFIRHVLPHALKHFTAMRFAKLSPEQARQGIEALRALNGHPEKEGDAN